MKLLTRQEELLLVIVYKLKDNAYGVTIGLELEQVTGHEWTTGALYDALYRLEKHGFIESRLSDPTAVRGGRSKRIFTINQNGIDGLNSQRNVHDKLWDGIIELKLRSNS